MSRKPTDTVQIGLRIRESLRRQLEKEAEKHHVSINQEMAMRLLDSFKTDAARSIDIVSQDLTDIYKRYSDALNQATLLADAVNAIEALLSVTIGTDSEAIQMARAKGRAVTKLYDTALAQAARKLHTT